MSGAVRLRRAIRQLHRWVGLLVAIQVLFWVAGGLIMSALRLDAVRGQTMAAPSTPESLDLAGGILPVDQLPARLGGDAVRSLTLTTLLDRPVYQLETATGPTLVDARNGQSMSPLPEAVARTVALADYTGPGALQSIDLLETPELEIRGRDLPLWRARFDDGRHTTLYISPTTGKVVARRNDLWRVFDFVWMLHIMDYEEREDFNHPLLVAAAATALLFVITGLAMLFYSFRPRAKA